MKKLMLSMACCSLLTVATFTPVVANAQGSSMDSKMAKDKDGSVKMVDGKMMVMKNGSWAAMTSEVTMSNGTKVKTDGTVMMKDGKTKMLKNGDCVKPDGMMKKM